MRRRIDWAWFALIGAIAGFLSGLFGVGGGITIDSDPDAEWRECFHKAASIVNL